MFSAVPSSRLFTLNLNKLILHSDILGRSLHVAFRHDRHQIIPVLACRRKTKAYRVERRLFLLPGPSSVSQSWAVGSAGRHHHTIARGRIWVHFGMVYACFVDWNLDRADIQNGEQVVRIGEWIHFGRTVASGLVGGLWVLHHVLLRRINHYRRQGFQSHWNKIDKCYRVPGVGGLLHTN